MQWLAKTLGGIVESRESQREYGPTRAIFDTDNPLFQGLDRSQTVWSSHGDSVTVLPVSASQVARSLDTECCEGFQLANPLQKIWALQFHPEVKETLCGKSIFWNFVFGICGCQKDWQAQNLIAEIREQIVQEVGDGKVIMGFSGGRDSTTLAKLASAVLGERLLAVCVDGGQLRLNESEEIQANAKHAGSRLIVVDARPRFAEAFANTVDAEEKRAVFKKLYTATLEEQAEKFDARFLFQGSLATDSIESGKTGGAVIKSHHNEGLQTKLKQVHPLHALFKYEVRALAQSLGLPESVCKRQPFPGPGLFTRVVGTPVTVGLLEIVRWADAQVTEILTRRGKMEEVDQLVVALIGVKTVGVKGDKRTYGYPIAVRPVVSADFMTAKGYHLPDEVEDEIVSKLTQHPEIVRGFFDPTPKPPATVEFE